MRGPVSVACVTDRWASWAVALAGVLGLLRQLQGRPSSPGGVREGLWELWGPG